MQLNINTDAVVKFTNKLEKLHKSAFPNAVRGALNKAAFNVKQSTLQKSADKNFVKRSPNFFKVFSKVEMAKGWDIDQMKSVVGMTSQGLKGSNNYAIEDLEQQERGGTIKKRSFIPLDSARGGSSAKPVRPSNRLSSIRKLVNAKRKNARSKKEAFTKSAIEAGVGGYVIGNTRPAIVWKISSIQKTKRGIRIRKKALYSYKENRNVRVKATNFMREAALESAKRIEHFYVAEAKRQFEKILK